MWLHLNSSSTKIFAYMCFRSGLKVLRKFDHTIYQTNFWEFYNDNSITSQKTLKTKKFLS